MRHPATLLKLVLLVMAIGSINACSNSNVKEKATAPPASTILPFDALITTEKGPDLELRFESNSQFFNNKGQTNFIGLRVAYAFNSK